MIRIHHLTILAAALMLLFAQAAFNPAGAVERRIALVIGNGAYETAPLANPVNDARDMAGLLEGLGFSVVRAIDVDRRTMRDRIRDFGDRIRRGGVALFYYAGHGIQVDGENYLVPVRARVFSEDEVEDECLRVSSVLRKMETAGNRLNIVILDACRNNPFGRRFRAMSRGLARMDAPAGSILAYATAPGSTAADGEGENGLYTSRLLAHMRKPGLEIGQLFRKVRADVMAATGEQQVPWESSSLVGNFYFVTEDSPLPPTPDETFARKEPGVDSGKTPFPKEKSPDPYGKSSGHGKVERNSGGNGSATDAKKPTHADFSTLRTGNTSKRIAGNRWDWTAYITGPRTILDAVRCVEYTLHRTFPNPVRTVCRKGGDKQAFPLSSNGWGTFRIKIRVFFDDGQVYSTAHDLVFR